MTGGAWRYPSVRTAKSYRARVASRQAREAKEAAPTVPRLSCEPVASPSPVRFRACQWIAGNPGSEPCGQRVQPDSSWCPEHYARVFHTITKRGF